MSDGSKFGLGCMYLIMLTVIGVLLNGWVLSILWAWFIVPIFGIHALTIVQALGLSAVVNFLVAHKSESKKNDDSTAAGALVEATLWMIFYPILSLSMGWIIHLFM